MRSSGDRTQVAIVGAGPAGLVLAHRLAAVGIESVIFESRARSYVEARVRAGVLEAPTVELLDEMGLADRLHRDGLVHHGVNLQWDGQRHRIDFAALTGRAVTVYGQQEVVKDLIAAWLDRGGELHFSTDVIGIEGVDGDRPWVRYGDDSGGGRLDCDFVAGCDGFHGVSRASLPAGAAQIYDREYPFAWLGVLADVAPSTDELIYAFHERGFAMHSLRSPRISRLYLQVDPTDDIADWSDPRIWDELQIRLAAPGWTLTEGPIIEKGITPMRSFVCEPMRYGRLFLAGDAAHIVPPTGAKGMNLAVADVKVLADALGAWYATGERSGLDGYSDRCLERVWRVQDFSSTMTALLHQDPTDDAFGRRVQRARRDYIASSRAMATSLAENYVGLPIT
jgi:p-hydroxybenzoate 3-monooxygenase